MTVTTTDSGSTHRNGWLLGVGDLPLYYRTWQPDTTARATVLITHGLGDHGGRYRQIGESLRAAGYAVYALDQRGHGRSAGPRTSGNLADSITDLSRMVGLIREDVPHRRLFLIGHSWGGMVTLAYTMDHEQEIDGVILSAPASKAATVPALRKLVGKALARIAPGTGVVDLPFDKACRDPAVIAAQRTDPLTYQGPIRARMAAQTLNAMAHIADGLPTLTLPMLLLHGTGDVISPPANSQFVYDRIASPDRTIIYYDGLWHQLFNEPEREKVYTDVKAWLERQTPPA